MISKINLAALLIRMGEVLLARARQETTGGLKFERLNLRCHNGLGEKGTAVRDLMEVEFIGLGNLGVDMSRKRQESEITPKLSTWVMGRMEVP